MFLDPTLQVVFREFKKTTIWKFLKTWWCDSLIENLSSMQFLFFELLSENRWQYI